MKTYRFWNNLTGWTVFALAAVVYIATCEPTASLWDCGEFIATAFKLEVGHPPGAPLFMLVARIATLFAGNDVALAARMVNYMSALASAFTILFLFWSITHIARKMVVKNGALSTADTIIVLGSGFVGALAYTFSDTFWFSAVEGEVYASSSLFTAAVFWAILKWESAADTARSSRWIVLIAYLMGLSIGVHLLNLLAIPAIVMVFYFRKFKPSVKGAVVAFAVSIAVLAFVMYGIIQGLISVASYFELFFVNTLHLPFNSGILLYCLLIVGVLVYGITYTVKKKYAVLNTIILGVSFILLGYTSYATIIIRANAETPINEDKPNNVFALLSYLNREQYGDRPLFYGQYYNAPYTDVTEDKPTYTPLNGKYEVTGHTYDVTYDARFNTFFPRMYSADANHIEVYKSWANVKGNAVTVEKNGQMLTEYVPTFGENLQFFFKYQVGYMYMRYFLWNFVGRQNDVQGNGGILKGSWISGIPFIDERLVGAHGHIPASIGGVPSRNVYYFLPFLLGVLGLLFLLDRNKNDFVVTLLLFVMTGLAIVLYLNQTPLQPRERDYAYAGSFYAFAIWIGLGVMALYGWIKTSRWHTLKAVGVTALCALAVPGIMATENWDDHNRSGRYLTRSYAYNYLNSCAPNALLFTFGDNDTFPLWYLQEVEGVRTDVRVVNLMLLNTDWYINQMQKKAYASDSLPVSLKYEQYMASKRARVYLVDQINDYVPLTEAITFVASDDPRTKTIQGYNQQIEYIPGRHFVLPVDTAAFLATASVSKANKAKIQSEIKFEIKGNAIDKSQLITLDMLANNHWKRPIYFVSINNDNTCGLDDYFQLEGFAYRLVPYKLPAKEDDDASRINTSVMYNNVMNVFDYGRMNEPDVYIDHFHERTLSVMKFRSTFAALAEALIRENKTDSALNVLNRCEKLASPPKVKDDMNTIAIAQAYMQAGDTTSGLKVARRYATTCFDELDYFQGMRPGYKMLIGYEIGLRTKVLKQLSAMLLYYKQPFANDINAKLEAYNIAFTKSE